MSIKLNIHLLYWYFKKKNMPYPGFDLYSARKTFYTKNKILLEKSVIFIENRRVTLLGGGGLWWVQYNVVVVVVFFLQ